MAEQGSESCRSCPDKHRCREIYEQLEKTKGPSVAFKSVAVFLVPLVVFIASLAIFERILTKLISTKALQTAISCLLALLVTFICILIIKASYEHQGKRKLQ